MNKEQTPEPKNHEALNIGGVVARKTNGNESKINNRNRLR